MYFAQNAKNQKKFAIFVDESLRFGIMVLYHQKKTLKTKTELTVIANGI